MDDLRGANSWDGARNCQPRTRTSESRGAGPRSRRKYVIGFVALLVFAVFAVVVASKSNPETVASRADVNDLSVGPVVPSLARSAGSTRRRSPTRAAGKVVLYDFWTYSCVNCVRTFPYLASWYDRYQRDGLVIVGVHSPEFDFEKDHGNVDAAVEAVDVTGRSRSTTTWRSGTRSRTSTGRPTTSPTDAADMRSSTSARAATPTPRT